MTTAVVTRTVYAANANFNQAQNTAVLTYVAWRPIRVIRYGAVADAAAGLLSPMDLKLRLTPVATGSAADLATLADQQLNGATKARGFGIVKTVGGQVAAEGTSPYIIDAGDTVTVCMETNAGGASTGHVFLEFEELPLSVGYGHSDNLVESA